MSWKAIRRPLLVAAVAATVGAAPSAALPVAQNARPLRACPDRAAAKCLQVPPPLGAEKVQKVRSSPHPATDSRGRTVWRSGRWLME